MLIIQMLKMIVFFKSYQQKQLDEMFNRISSLTNKIHMQQRAINAHSSDLTRQKKINEILNKRIYELEQRIAKNSTGCCWSEPTDTRDMGHS